MKVLVVHRYFWPDTPPYAWMLREIGARLAADGHDVTVLSSQPSYNPAAGIGAQPRVESLDGVRVVRCRLLPEDRSKTLVRMLNVALFCLRILVHIVRHRGYAVVMCTTFPPVAASTTASLSAKLIGARFVYNMQDIYPEIAVASRVMGDGPMFRLLRWIDTRTVRRASLAVVLSQDMRLALGRRGVETAKVRVINNLNFTDADEAVVLPPDLEKPEGVFRVLFAGNLGRFQGLSSVVDAARRFEDGTVRFEFLGDGVARAEMERRAGDALGRSVFFHGYRAAEISQRMLETADLGLVTLTQGVIRYAYPSKVIACLAAGTPLLVAMEADSELARTVRELRIGFVVPPDEPERLVEAVREAHGDPDGLVAMRRAAREVFEDRFEGKRVLDEWSKLLAGLDAA